MKSVLSKLCACSAFILASVAANAAVNYSTPMHVIGHANLSHSLLAIVAAADDDQADSSEAETMLA